VGKFGYEVASHLLGQNYFFIGGLFFFHKNGGGKPSHKIKNRNLMNGESLKYCSKNLVTVFRKREKTAKKKRICAKNGKELAKL
jgi:hypothetical protein